MGVGTFILQGILLDGCGGLNPESVVWRHLEQDNIDDGGFAAPIQDY